MARILGTNGDDLLRGQRLAPPLKQAGLPQADDPDPWTDPADLIDGRAGDDSLYGGSGPDRLIGGAGRDVLEGGTGNDTILPAGGTFLTHPEANIVDGGEGRDLVSYEDEPVASVILALDGSLSYDTLTGIEHLRGGGGGDRLTGDAGRNRIEGMGGRDTLFGGDGADSLVGGDEFNLGDDLYGGRGGDILDGGRGFDYLDGGEGADLLRGGEGPDVLQGGRGNDTLQGGTGTDTLSGGAGNDVFRYASAAEGRDLVLGYAARHDQVQVLAAGFGGGLVAGMDLAATGHYVENGPATAPAGTGQFVFDTATATLFWDADGAGEGAAVVILELSESRGWSAQEISVI